MFCLPDTGYGRKKKQETRVEASHGDENRGGKNTQIAHQPQSEKKCCVLSRINAGLSRLTLARPLTSPAAREQSHFRQPSASFKIAHNPRESLNGVRGKDDTLNSVYRGLSMTLGFRFVRLVSPSRARGLLPSANSRHSKQRP